MTVDGMFGDGDGFGGGGGGSGSADGPMWDENGEPVASSQRQRERYNGPYNVLTLEDLHKQNVRDAADMRAVNAINAMFGRPAQTALDFVPKKEAITPATFGGGGAQSARSRPKTRENPGEIPNYLLPKGSRSKSARASTPAADSAPAVPYMSEEECKRAYAETARLAPFKRVEARIRLLRDHEYLRDWISNKVELEKIRSHEKLDVDFIRKNQQSTTPAARKQKEKEKEEARELEKIRTSRAQEIAKVRRKEGLSSEEAQRLRQHRRGKELLRGWKALLRERRRQKGKRWAVVSRIGYAAVTMVRIAKLARIVKKIRTTSRVIRAVTTVQRRWRERKTRRENQLKLAQILAIQRVGRRFVYHMKCKKMGRASDLLISFLKGNERLSPLEMALKRYLLRVRLVQRYVRGFQSITNGKMALLRMQWHKFEMARLVKTQMHGGAVVGSLNSKEKDKPGFAKGGRQELVEAGKALINVVQKGEYAGVPETMLDMPLPHVPERLREKKLKKLLRDMRQAFIQETILWDQKVMLQAERHPALIGGEKGVQRLAVIQHELHRDIRRKSVTEKYASVLAIFDHMVVEESPAQRSNRLRQEGHEYDGVGSPGGERGGGGGGGGGGGVNKAMTKKLQRLNSSLSAQRQALEEIRNKIPRPFQRMLVPKETLAAAFEDLYHRCSETDEWELRTIRPPMSPGNGRNKNSSSREGGARKVSVNAPSAAGAPGPAAASAPGPASAPSGAPAPAASIRSAAEQPPLQ